MSTLSHTPKWVHPSPPCTLIYHRLLSNIPEYAFIYSITAWSRVLVLPEYMYAYPTGTTSVRGSGRDGKRRKETEGDGGRRKETEGDLPSSISCCFRRFSDWASSSFSSWTCSDKSSVTREDNHYMTDSWHAASYGVYIYGEHKVTLKLSVFARRDTSISNGNRETDFRLLIYKRR